MSNGSTHTLNGKIELFGATLRLRTPDGETWRLFAPSWGYGLVGRTVKLEGTRVGVDELDVGWVVEASPS